MATLTTLAFVLLGLWVLSFFVFQIAGFLIHLLLIVAIVMILVRIIKGENPFK